MSTRPRFTPNLRGLVPTALVAALLCAVTGCGKGVADVKGKVTYNGKPVTSGTVNIQSSEGETLSGEIKPDGSYLIEKVPCGPAKVSVVSIDPNWSDKVRKLAAAQQQRFGGGKGG